MSGGFLFLQNLHRRADLIPEYEWPRITEPYIISPSHVPVVPDVPLVPKDVPEVPGVPDRVKK